MTSRNKTNPGVRNFHGTRTYLTSLCKIPWIWRIQEGMDIAPEFRHSDHRQCMFCGHVWLARNRGHKSGDRCPNRICNRSQIDQTLHRHKCRRCGHEWAGTIMEPKLCPRCRLPMFPGGRTQIEPVMYALFSLYRDELDLIWGKVGLREHQFMIIREYLCVGCYSGAGRKCNLSKQRVEQVVKRTYSLLSKAGALRELKRAMELFGKDTAELDRYIECSRVMFSIVE